MPDTKPWTVFWTTQALQNAESIKDCLNKNFSQKEIDAFYSLLNTFEEIISLFPQLFPATKRSKKIRRAMLSKEVSLF